MTGDLDFSAWPLRSTAHRCCEIMEKPCPGEFDEDSSRCYECQHKEACIVEARQKMQRWR